MKIVTYNQQYEADVVKLWNQELPADTITVKKFRHQALLDDNFDSELCYVALEEEKVAGFLLATKRKFPYLERGTEPERGWINVMFVDRSLQRRGIGTQLLQRAEADLKARSASNITLAAYSPSYFFPGVDIENYKAGKVFFEKMGYQGGEISYSMCKDLHSFQLSEETEKKLKAANEAGYRFEMFTYQYAIDLLNFARDEFGGGWKRNCLLTMQNDRAEDCILLVLDKEDNICGFCTRMIDGNPMRFGPIGTSEKVRNQGLGGILFDLAQLEMKKRGIYHLYFISTDEPGRRFYERHGVHVFRTFQDYKKQI
jgi:GNAT superfamily N-acetyltransferase